jgi:hypothetical protein
MEKKYIGLKYISTDNSYQKNMSTGEKTHIGGTAWDMPITTTIISEPFNEIVEDVFIEGEHTSYSYSFVIVEDKAKNTYRTLFNTKGLDVSTSIRRHNEWMHSFVTVNN